MKQLKFLIVFFIAILSVSCSADLELDAPVATDLPFLSLPDDTDFDNLTDNDKIILMKAHSRVKIFENLEGLYELGVKSAKEINVSDNIYIYFIRLIHNTNTQLLLECGNNRNSLISRDPSDFMIDSKRLAIAVNFALEQPYAPIYDYITTEHGQVCSFNDLEKTLTHFGKGKFVSPEYFTSGELLTSKMIIFYNTSSNDPQLKALNGSYIPFETYKGKLYFMGYDRTDGTGEITIYQSFVKKIFIYD